MATLDWQRAEVTGTRTETPTVKTITLRPPHWQAHLPGQHYDIRLTAEDGYQAQRSYSVASPPELRGYVELTVERIPDGEVSPYLHDHLAPGHRLEIRGPIGGYFTWRAATADRPLLLVAGGSGVVPLMAILRHRRATGARVAATLLYSVRREEAVIYHDELEELAAADPTLTLLLTYTRRAPADWTGYHRRVDAAMLRAALATLPAPPRCYVCGPSGLVEHTANALVDLGLPTEEILTERFGPTGT